MRFFIALILSLVTISANTQTTQKKSETKLAGRPKLVVGIVIDQMRWDFLYRFHDRYSTKGGFKRMMYEGFSFDNTFIPYMPTVTGCGHASIYTGTVPAINGIVGNNWPDRKEGRMVYCSEDKNVNGVGTNASSGQMSPRNMLSTSVCDELKLATNFKSKVIGVAMKDRGSILPAGHSADAAYWYESKSGNWISSTHYLDRLPEWVNKFNDSKFPDFYYKKGWNTLYDIQTYHQSTKDNKDYAGSPFGKDQKGFPYNLQNFIGNNYDPILKTPHGNSLTLSFAKEAIRNESLGSDEITDFLAISFSSPDYIGHIFGPNSIEIEDNYIRLDQELGAFFDYLDATIGKGNYLCFLTADHGVAHVPEFLKQHNIPGGVIDDKKITDTLNTFLKQKYGGDKLIYYLHNYQLYVNHERIDSLGISTEDVYTDIINFCHGIEGIDRIFELDEVMETPLPVSVREQIVNGYHPKRSGDLQVILKPGWIDGSKTGTTHGLWNPYDSHIPLLWYGWKIPKGASTREVYMTDIAVTVSALLHIQMPSGSIGKSLISLMNIK
ncbi:MAG: alkaline phosphatase PafA [Bacteroidota bacterium]|jgi:predicted AlkP superfamily pyrophosphatase or phosphodiesterase